MNRKIETFLGCGGEYDSSRVIVFGAPFDSTTSFRPGARFAPKAMRSESWGLESFSPYQDRDLSDFCTFDYGDLELPFGSPEPALEQIEELTREALRDGKLPFMMGGEHLVTLGAVRAVFAKYPDLRIIHFDAHADLRDDYLGEEFSHACVMRRAWELVGDGRIYQFGIRSGERDEFEFAKEHTVMEKFGLYGLERAVDELSGKPVYVTIDLDVLDPSVFPGTGTPEPGGVSFMELFHAIIGLGRLNIVGCDIVELAPGLDASGASTAAACKIMRELLLVLGGEVL